jgi:hypothetical protein
MDAFNDKERQTRLSGWRTGKDKTAAFFLIKLAISNRLKNFQKISLFYRLIK